MAKSRFRIIALRPITPKYVTDEELAVVKTIQKKVYGSSWLYFYRGYELSDADTNYSEFGTEAFYGYQLKTSKNVFDDSALYDQDDVCISIGAIVGQNGSGKSSIIELIIRILNNLSVAAKGETVNHSAAEHLFFIENVYGCIVLQEGDRYIQIKVEGRSVTAAVYQWVKDENVYICNSPLELLSETMTFPIFFIYGALFPITTPNPAFSNISLSLILSPIAITSSLFIFNLFIKNFIASHLFTFSFIISV